jgi:hypothetical protein
VKKEEEGGRDERVRLTRENRRQDSRSDLLGRGLRREGSSWFVLGLCEG